MESIYWYLLHLFYFNIMHAKLQVSSKNKPKHDHGKTSKIYTDLLIAWLINIEKN